MWLNGSQMVGALDCRVAVPPVLGDARIERIIWDSRKIEEGCAFLAIEGERVDGNDFIASAIEAGALFAIATKEPPEAAVGAARMHKAGLVVVDDAVKAMEQMASYVRRRMDATVVGITGSSGKTTTKNMIGRVLSSQFETVATQGNQNNELGVPNTVLSCGVRTEMLVVEMGMRGFGQIEHLCGFVRPHIGVITNIGTAHEELLGSQENIARAKSELIAALPPSEGIAVLNGDDPFTPAVREFADVAGRGVKAITYGMSFGCDVRALDVRLSPDGLPSFDIAFPHGRTGHVDLPIAGIHNVMNALAAAAVGFACDIPMEKICNALRRVEGQAMRQEMVSGKGGSRIINDAYNANPDSMQAALSLLATMEASGRKVAVLGDMGELGPREREMHRAVGEAAAAAGVDLLVTVGELSREMAAGAMSAGLDASKVVECDDTDAALEAVAGGLGKGDLVLVKASRFMELENVVKGLVD